jgi:hypothetical protein
VADEDLVGGSGVRRPAGEDLRVVLGRVGAVGRNPQLDLVVRHRAAGVGPPPEREVDGARGLRDLRQPLDTV